MHALVYVCVRASVRADAYLYRRVAHPAHELLHCYGGDVLRCCCIFNLLLSGHRTALLSLSLTL